MTDTPARSELAAEMEDLRTRLAEAEEVLRAIRNGEVDAVVVSGERGEQVYSLIGADRVYRRLIETMSEGAATLSADGVILYSNTRLAEILGQPLDQIPGTSLRDHLPPADQEALRAVLTSARTAPVRREISLQTSDGRLVPVYLSASPCQSEETEMVFALVLTDLTEQKRHEQVVAAERLARSILEQAAEAIVVCDDRGMVTHANQASRQYCEGNPLLRPFGEVFPLLTGVSDEFQLTPVLEGKTLRNLVTTLERHGHRLDFILNAGPLLSGQQRLGCVITMINITERKQAEGELRESEERYRRLMENLDAGVVVHAPDTSIRMTNPRSSELLGVSEDQMKGRLAIDPNWKFISVSEAPLPLEDYPVNRIATSKKPIKNLTLGVCRPLTNDIVWLMINGIPVFNGKGELSEIIVSFIDVTERKQAEEAIRTSASYARSLIEASLDPLVTIGSDGKITDVNNSTEQVTGRTRKELIGTNFLDYFTEPEKAQSGYAQVFQNGSVYDYPLSIRHTSGKITDVLYNATVYRNEAGEVQGVFAAARDITERKRAEEELRRHREHLEVVVAERTAELQAMNRELEAFSYSVSHDLRAPLRSVDGFAQMIEEDHAERLDDEGRRLLQVIRDSARDMGQLISDLLAFSRLSRKELKMGRIGMRELVEEVRRQVKQAEAGRAIRWDLGELPPAFGDETMIREVLNNLLSNAVKYTRPRREAVIGISGRVEGDDVVYCVTDNGVGFDMAYKDKLFGVFQRLHTTAEFEGTGIGLALVQRIVHRHGGKVWAEGKVNEGATFYFALPCAKNEEEEAT